MALPRGAMGLSAVVIVVFPDDTHLLFFPTSVLKDRHIFFLIKPISTLWQKASLILCILFSGFAKRFQLRYSATETSQNFTILRVSSRVIILFKKQIKMR